MLVGPARRQGEEGAVVDEIAVGEAQLAERLSLGKKRSDRLVPDLSALVQVNFEDIRAVFGKGENGLVGQ